MKHKEKIFYIALVGFGALQVLNVYQNKDTNDKVKIINEKIVPLEVEIQNIKKDVKILKGHLYEKDTNPVLSEREQTCLAYNIFHEAGVESVKGKIAVAQITHNRLKTNRWGKDICSVVYARKQFSWTLFQKNHVNKPKGPLWNDSVRAMKAFVDGKRVKGLEDSLHYHTDYIKTPKWAVKKTKALTLGQHIFYVN